MEAFRSGLCALFLAATAGNGLLVEVASAAERPPLEPDDLAALLADDTPGETSAQRPQELPAWEASPKPIAGQAEDSALGLTPLTREDGIAQAGFASDAIAHDIDHHDIDDHDIDDIADLLEREQALDVHSAQAIASDRAASQRSLDAQALTIDQLERAATGRPSDHGLSRLIVLGERTARAVPESDDATRTRIANLLAWALNARGGLRALRGDAAAALADFDAALEHKPDAAEPLHNRAISLAEAGRQQEALRSFDRAIAARPHWVGALRNRAMLHASLGDLARALADCDAAIAVAPALGARGDEPTRGVLEVRGDIYRRLSRPLDALADYTDALEGCRQPAAIAGLCVERASVLMELGRYDEATDDCFAALEADARNAEAYRGLAWLLSAHPDVQQRDTALAQEAATRAKRMLGETPATLEAEAAALAASGDLRGAKRLQRQAIRLAEPDSSGAEQRIRLAAYEAGDAWTLPTPSAVVNAVHTED